MNLSKVILDEILENSSASIGASYEGGVQRPHPMYSSSTKISLSTRYGCHKIKNHRQHSRCMLNARLLELKKQYKLCQDDNCRREILIKLRKWQLHYRAELGRNQFRKESVELEEQLKSPINILKDKNTGTRITSKEGYITIRSELTRALQDTKEHIKRTCLKIEDKENRKICKNKQYMQLIQRIESLKGGCFRASHHNTRCLKACNTLINHLRTLIKN